MYFKQNHQESISYLKGILISINSAEIEYYIKNLKFSIKNDILNTCINNLKDIIMLYEKT